MFYLLLVTAACLALLAGTGRLVQAPVCVDPGPTHKHPLLRRR